MIASGKGDGVVGDDLFPETRFLGAIVGGHGGHSGGAIETEAGHGVLFVMALETLAAQQGADVFVEGDVDGDVGVTRPRIFLPTRGEGKEKDK